MVKNLATTGCRAHLQAVTFQHALHQPAHRGLVLDNQHGSGDGVPARVGEAVEGYRRGFVGQYTDCNGEPHLHRGTDADRGGHAQKTRMLLCDAVRGGQAKTSSLARWLRREERFEDTRQVFRCDAGAGVLHCQHGVRTGSKLGHLGLLDRATFGANDDQSSRNQCVACVQHEVEQHLLDHATVGQHHERIGRSINGELVRSRHHTPQQTHVGAYKRVEIQQRGLHGLLTTEHQQLSGEANGTLGRGFDIANQLDRFARHGLQQSQFVELQQHGRQHVVEVVRHAARQLSDRFHLLTLAQSLLAGREFLQHMCVRLGRITLLAQCRGEDETDECLHTEVHLQNHERATAVSSAERRGIPRQQKDDADAGDADQAPQGAELTEAKRAPEHEQGKHVRMRFQRSQ